MVVWIVSSGLPLIALALVLWVRAHGESKPPEVTVGHVEQAAEKLRELGLLNDTDPDLPDGTRSAERWLAAIREDAGMVQYQLESTLRPGHGDKALALAIAAKEARRMQSDIYRFGHDVHGVDRETIDAQGPL